MCIVSRQLLCIPRLKNENFKKTTRLTMVRYLHCGNCHPRDAYLSSFTKGDEQVHVPDGGSGFYAS
jgi:hypothetical protein